MGVFLCQTICSLQLSLRFTVLIITKSNYYGFRSPFFGHLSQSNSVISFWSSGLIFTEKVFGAKMFAEIFGIK